MSEEEFDGAAAPDAAKARPKLGLRTKKVEEPVAVEEIAQIDVPIAEVAPILAKTADAEDDAPAVRTTLQELKLIKPAELVAMAEALEIDGAATLRTQDLLFAILKTKAENGAEIGGSGVLEVLPDGFGFLRSPESNYLPGPDDIYVSPSQTRRYGLRTGDTVEGPVKAPRDGERYFALHK
ncbi:MAG: Rho termination factor N-terminal domain-containing protein, partial [Pseudomonadota bacterium]